jgi:hypothetical protein
MGAGTKLGQRTGALVERRDQTQTNLKRPIAEAAALCEQLVAELK